MSFAADPIIGTPDLPPEIVEGIRRMIGQLPIVFALRNGGEIRIPVAEIDATGPYVLNMSVEGNDLVFRAGRKS